MNFLRKNVFLLCLLLVVAGLVPLSAAENVDAWTQAYKESSNDEQRRTLLIKIMEFRDKDFGPLLLVSLDDLYYRRIDKGTSNERATKIDLTRLIVQELGDLQVTDAATRIYSIYQEVKNPLLQAECALSLGKLRATTYGPILAKDLSTLNGSPIENEARNQEVLAFGLVQGLDAMHFAGGYESVFLSSVGWYSPQSKIKETARAVAARLSDDPSAELQKILQTNEYLTVKNTATDALIASKASPEKKAGFARALLRVAFDINPLNGNEALQLATLRKKAISILVTSQDKSKDSIPLLSEYITRIKETPDTYDEILQIYTALGYNSSDDAAKFLTARLEYYNDRQQKGLNTPRDKVLVREIIAAMKRAKNAAAKPTLIKTQYIDSYDVAIKRDAEDAVKSLGSSMGAITTTTIK